MFIKNLLKFSWSKGGLEVNIENKSSGIILFIITVLLIIMLLKLIDNIILVVEIIRRTVKGEGGLREERLRYVLFNRLYRIPIIFIGILGLLYILFKDVSLNDCMNFMCMGPFFPSGIMKYPRLKRLGVIKTRWKN